MKWLRLVRCELRKISTTKLHWGFLAALIVISAATATAIVIGTDADGSKGFISTGEDQRSLLAFGANALVITAIFGAIVAARDYDHHTVVPMFLVAPKRHHAMTAQFVAAFVAGALLGLAGQAVTLAAGIIALPIADFELLMGFRAIAEITGASILGGAVGAVIGASIGALVRNSAGAATGAVLLLLIIPPLVVQLVDVTNYVPGMLMTTISGVSSEPGMVAALVVLAAWALVPGALAIFVARRRDIA